MLKVIKLIYRPSIILNYIEVGFKTVLAKNLSEKMTYTARTYVRMYALTIYAQTYIKVAFQR